MCGITKKQSKIISVAFWLGIGLTVGMIGVSVAAAETGEAESTSASGKRVMMLIGDAQDFRGCEKLGSVKGTSQEKR